MLITLKPSPRTCFFLVRDDYNKHTCTILQGGLALAGLSKLLGKARTQPSSQESSRKALMSGMGVWWLSKERIGVRDLLFLGPHTTGESMLCLCYRAPGR